MSQAQKFILWGAGVFVLINLVAIGLSRWFFGHLDGPVIWEMVLIALPPLLVASGAYFALGAEAGWKKGRQERERYSGRRGEVRHEKPSHESV